MKKKSKKDKKNKELKPIKKREDISNFGHNLLLALLTGAALALSSPRRATFISARRRRTRQITSDKILDTEILEDKKDE